MIPDAKLDFYIDNNLNVHFEGPHGVGKTQIVLGAWKRKGLKFLYFSAATMDPWVDLIGIPKEKHVKDAHGNEVECIRVVPPETLALDDIDAIFFDEYNRAPEKVRNATMQFIQMKEINGRKLNNLRMIWIATNPSDTGEYDVEMLDPAQADRFHIHIEIPFDVDTEYFDKKYPVVGRKFYTWWQGLGEEQKKLISPRRLEMALNIHELGGDVNDVFHKSINAQELIDNINHGSVQEILDELLESDDEEQIRNFIIKRNTTQKLKEIFGTPPTADTEEKYTKMFRKFVPYMATEDAIAISSDNGFTIFDNCLYNAGYMPSLVESLKVSHPKKDVIPKMMGGLAYRAFKVDSVVDSLDKEDKQLSIIGDINGLLSEDPNKVYASAYILNNIKSNWPDLLNKQEVQTFQNKVSTLLPKYPAIQAVFND